MTYARDYTNIIDAAEHFDADQFIQFVEQKHPNLDEQDGQGNTALMIAVQQDKQDILEYLIHSGANLDIQNRKKRTALMQAVIDLNTKAALTLIQAGADIHLRDKDNRTVLSFVASTIQIMRTVENASGRSGIVDAYRKIMYYFVAVGADIDDLTETQKAQNKEIIDKALIEKQRRGKQSVYEAYNAQVADMTQVLSDISTQKTEQARRQKRPLPFTKRRRKI